jgi:hypothetical protein
MTKRPKESNGAWENFETIFRSERRTPEIVHGDADLP